LTTYGSVNVRPTWGTTVGRVRAHLGTVLHNWVKKYPQRVFLEPQCLRYEIGELVAQVFALGEVSQEILFKPRDILIIMPLK